MLTEPFDDAWHGDDFGVAVAVSHDGAVIGTGADYAEDDGTIGDAGLAFIFDRPGGMGGWNNPVPTAPSFTLTGSSGHCGHSVSLNSSGSRLAGACDSLAYLWGL
jgi:hypothetical protein